MKMSNRIVHYLPDHGIPRGLDFGYYHYTAVQPKLDTHRHTDVLELCFCIKGKQQYVINETRFGLRGNDILIVPPNTNHGTGDFPEDKGELFWLQIDLVNKQELLCNLPNDHAEVLLGGLLKASGRIISGALQIKYYLEQLTKELKTSDTVLSKIKINQLILQILLETLRQSTAEQAPNEKNRFLRIDAFIKENIHRPIYIDELASCVQLSTGYFKTWFLKNAGITPKEYINRMKIEFAKSLLMQKSSITAVAFALGFSSSQYFSTTFKKFTGQTPKVFIKAGRR